MTKKLSILFMLTVISCIFLGVASAQEAAGQEEKANVWTENCKHVARFSRELIFTVRLVEPKGTATNRQHLLNILSSIKLDDAPKLKKKQESVIADVKKAPAFKDNFGKADMTIPEKLGQSLNDFLTSVSAEAKKHGVECK